MFLHYSFHPVPCFVDRLTSVPVFSKLACLHVPQPQELSSSALESPPRNPPLRPKFSLLEIITSTMLAVVIIPIVDVSPER